MSGPDLILQFILGVLASYLASALHERSKDICRALTSSLAATKALCYRVSFKIFSLLKVCMVLAGTKLAALTMDVRYSPLAFLLTAIVPFKADKETALYIVPEGGDLQAAIYAAHPGDIILYNCSTNPDGFLIVPVYLNSIKIDCY